jgi:hypothetical protein
MREMDSVRSKGIEPVTVGVSQLVLPPKTAQAVLMRMQATRTKLSDQERGKGQARATAIQNRAAADAEKIKAFAEQLAADIRAKGEQESARYLTRMGEAEELAIFLLWCDTLQSSFSKYATLVMPVSTAPLHLLNLGTPVDRHGIPQPPTTQPGPGDTAAAHEHPQPPVSAEPTAQPASTATPAQPAPAQPASAQPQEPVDG